MKSIDEGYAVLQNDITQIENMNKAKKAGVRERKQRVLDDWFCGLQGVVKSGESRHLSRFLDVDSSSHSIESGSHVSQKNKQTTESNSNASVNFVIPAIGTQRF